jgi:hypothetical protein
MHPLYYYFGTPDSDSADDTYDPTHECFNIDGAIASNSEDEAAIGEGMPRHLWLSPLLHGMKLNSLWIKKCNSSKSVNYRTGSTRNEKICAYFNKPLSMSARHTHTVEELEKELAMSIIASSRIRRVNHRSSAELARMLSQPPCFFVTCPSHRTLRPIGPTMKSENSSRPLPCSRPRVPPRGDAGLPRSSLWCPLDGREREASVHPEPAPQWNKAASVREHIVDNRKPRDAHDNINER